MNAKPNEHPLNDYFNDMQRKMQECYERIRKKHSRPTSETHDTGIAGDKGETNWKNLLSEWFPQFRYMTKVSIVFNDGSQSPEVDLVMLRPDFPIPLLKEKQVLADAIVAAFECKLTLYQTELVDVLDKARIVKERSTRPFFSDAYFHLNGRFPYGLLTHSHEWKKPKSTPFENVERNLQTLILENTILQSTSHPSNLFDFVCVADLGTWRIDTVVHPALSSKNAIPRPASIGTVIGAEDTPAIATLLVTLNARLAEVGHLDAWFSSVVAQSTGVGESWGGKRFIWPETVFAPDVISKLHSNKLLQTRNPNQLFLDLHSGMP